MIDFGPVTESSYAQKHPHQVACFVTACNETASKLVLLHHKPQWVCDSHYNDIIALAGKKTP